MYLILTVLVSHAVAAVRLPLQEQDHSLPDLSWHAPSDHHPDKLARNSEGKKWITSDVRPYLRERQMPSTAYIMNQRTHDGAP